MQGYLWSDGIYRTVPEYQGAIHSGAITAGMSGGKQTTPRTSAYILCPFCGLTGFDLIGLKSHLNNGDCEQYNNVEDIQRI